MSLRIGNDFNGSRNSGGDATLIHTTDVEGLADEEIEEMFNATRAEEYAALITELARSLRRTSGSAQILSSASWSSSRCDSKRFAKSISSIVPTHKMHGCDSSVLVRCIRKAGEVVGQKLLWAHVADSNATEIDQVGSAWLILALHRSEYALRLFENSHGASGSVTLRRDRRRILAPPGGLHFRDAREALRLARTIPPSAGENGRRCRLGGRQVPACRIYQPSNVTQTLVTTGMSDEMLLHKDGACFEAPYDYFRER